MIPAPAKDRRESRGAAIEGVHLMQRASLVFALAGALLLIGALFGETIPLLLPVATIGIAAALRFSHDTAVYLRILIGLIAFAHTLLGTLYLIEIYG